MDKETQQYIESLGWVKHTDDHFTGYPQFSKTVEVGFNTGTEYILMLHPKTTLTTEDLMVNIEEHEYGSWSQSQKLNQYTLENIKQLEQLMKFKRIK